MLCYISFYKLIGDFLHLGAHNRNNKDETCYLLLIQYFLLN